MVAPSTNLVMPTQVVSRLRCPRCHAGLILRGTSAHCSSPSCSLAFPLLNGTLILFDEARSIFSRSTVERATAGKAPTSRIRTIFERILPTLELNVTAKRNSLSFAGRLFASCSQPIVLNIGGKHAGAACASLRLNPAAQVVEMDVRAGPATNLIADPLEIPFEGETFDAVIIDAVLEHVIDPEKAVSEIWRVLKPNGMVYSDVPFMLQVHGGALDFWRFSHVGHRRLFRAFDELQSGISQGPSVALECAVLYFLLSFVHGKHLRYTVRAFCRLSLFWLKYVDYYLARKPGSIDAAMGTFFIGRKSEAPISDRKTLDAYRGASPDLHPVR